MVTLAGLICTQPALGRTQATPAVDAPPPPSAPVPAPTVKQDATPRVDQEQLPPPTPNVAPPPPPPPAAGKVAGPGDAPTEATPVADPSGAYNVRLGDLARRVNDLKEQIFRSKARLNLLKETVLHGVIAGARAVIVHRNEMGAMFQPVRIVYALDGAEIFSKADDNGQLMSGKELEIYNGSVVPGNHTLSTMVVYRGNGFGVFSYLKGYRYTVRKSHNFTAPEGKVTTLKVVGYERGNALTTDPKDRPDIEFRSNSEADRSAESKSAPAAAAKQGAK